MPPQRTTRSRPTRRITFSLLLLPWSARPTRPEDRIGRTTATSYRPLSSSSDGTYPTQYHTRATLLFPHPGRVVSQESDLLPHETLHLFPHDHRPVSPPTDGSTTAHPTLLTKLSIPRQQTLVNRVLAFRASGKRHTIPEYSLYSSNNAQPYPTPTSSRGPPNPVAFRLRFMHGHPVGSDGARMAKNRPQATHSHQVFGAGYQGGRVSWPGSRPGRTNPVSTASLQREAPATRWSAASPEAAPGWKLPCHSRGARRGFEGARSRFAFRGQGDPRGRAIHSHRGGRFGPL